MSTEKKLVTTVPPPYQIHKCSVITDTHYVAEFAPVMRPTIESIIQKANSHAALVAALKAADQAGLFDRAASETLSIPHEIRRDCRAAIALAEGKAEK